MPTPVRQLAPGANAPVTMQGGVLSNAAAVFSNNPSDLNVKNQDLQAGSSMPSDERLDDRTVNI